MAPWIRFLVYTFILTWVVGIVMIIPLTGIENVFQLPENSISNLFIKYGPSLGGILTGYLVYGKEGLINLLKRGLKWKIKISNYLFALLIPILIKIHIFWTLDYAISWTIPDFEILNSMVIFFLTHLLLGGGFGEEFGWRGFMLSELSKKESFLKTSLIIGFFWAIWHLPAYLLGDKGESEPILAFFLLVTACSFIMSWLYIRSNQSVFIVAIFHAMINASGKMLIAVSNVEESEVENANFVWAETYALLMLSAMLLILKWRWFFYLQNRQ